MQNKKLNYIDVTKEWISKANPNSHEIKELNYWIINNKKHKVDGKKILLDYNKSELECAKWLKNTFGGEIYLCPRVNIPEGVKTPDYIWNGECWDLKELKGKSSRLIDDIIKGTKGQTNNLILDISKTKLTKEIILKQIFKLFEYKERKWIKKIIVKSNSLLINVLIRK